MKEVLESYSRNAVSEPIQRVPEITELAITLGSAVAVTIIVVFDHHLTLITSTDLQSNNMTCIYIAGCCSDLVGGLSVMHFVAATLSGDVATVSVLCMGVLVYSSRSVYILSGMENFTKWILYYS